MALMKRVAVLGSTGSIGTNTLDVIASHPEALRVFGLAARSRINDLEAQIARHRPECVVVLDPEKASELRQRCGAPASTPDGARVEILDGEDGLVRLATHPDVDVVVVGTSGREALGPLLRAIEAGKRIALASKELLVMAGELIMRAVEAHHAELIPVDSEHAGLFQVLQGVPREQVERIVLTGSGGSLWPLDAAALRHVSREQVLRHPKWQMGPKITVDSATLMNKGLEVIEARWLFGMPCERIRVVIHPQAVVHAFIELVDGSCLAQLAICDMRVPIQYALSFPARWPSRLPRLEMTTLPALQFFEPDLERFPCLALALGAARQGGSACTVLSAANEVAVQAYLRGALSFEAIPTVIRHTLARHEVVTHPTLEEILRVDAWARATADACLPAVSVAAAEHGAGRAIVKHRPSIRRAHEVQSR